MNIRVVNSSGSGTGKIIWGCILAVLFGLAAIGCAIAPDREEQILPMIVCGGLTVLGFRLIVKGVRANHRMKHMVNDLPEFGAEVPAHIQDRIEELMRASDSPNVSIKKTVKRVTCIRADGTSHTTETVTESRDGYPVSGNSQAGAVICKACGGISKLRRGQSGICEYCGSHIQG